ncbi:integrase catalytic domain-containing protein [Trichonephila clavipes]|nr:integrase catalytic domain-containing protein [Trichonephila clavipes]
MMSDLPSSRISPAPAFMRCGVDYAAPFQIKIIKGRGSKSFKAYIALFVCFTIRAIHLELVTDLSADAFIAALKRLFPVEENAVTYTVIAVPTCIKGHQNVPGAPHMGGLWKAGIKSTKYHLKRVVGETKLTYEEFETFLTQIEACLNSRPLTPISNDL